MMASQLPPARNSSQSSRFKSAATTAAVAVRRISKTTEKAEDDDDEASSTSRTLPALNTSAASARNDGPAGSKDEVTSSARRSVTLLSSNFECSNQTAGARVDIEVAVIYASRGAVAESVVMPTPLEPTLRGKDFSTSPLSHTGVSTGTQSPYEVAGESGIAAAETLSAMRADCEVVAMPLHGANRAGPGEAEDEYDEPAAWFVPANTKLHTGSKLFWRIKRTIDFKLYV